MAERLIYFQCAGCGYHTYRYHAAYERMQAFDGRTLCLLCAPPGGDACARQREALDVSQALMARSRAVVAAHRHTQLIMPA